MLTKRNISLQLILYLGVVFSSTIVFRPKSRDPTAQANEGQQLGTLRGPKIACDLKGRDILYWDEFGRNRLFSMDLSQ